MGGFKPSRSDIAGSTIVGSDKDVDVHQFTGSVDITGSLTLNGSAVTGGGGGGGGGAVANYTNSGDNRVITSVDSDTINGEANLTFDETSLTSPQVTASVSMKTAALEISSSAEGALFRIDHATQSGPEPIFFVTGSGLVGIGTDSPLSSTPAPDTNRLHIVGNNGAEQGEAPVINTQLVLENNEHAGLQFMFPATQAGQITWGIPGNARKAVFYYSSANDRYEFNGPSFGGARVMTMLAGGDSVNIGKSASLHMTSSTACLHISSSTGGTDAGGPVLLRVDHADQPGAQPTLFVTGSGRVGIGTETPNNPLEIFATTSQQRWSYDTGDNNFATMTVSSAGDMTLSGSNYATASIDGGEIHLDAGGKILLQSDAGSFQFQRPGNTNRFVVDTSGGDVFLTNIQNTSTIFRGLTNQTTQLTLDPLNTRVLLPTTHSMAFRDAATTIHSIAANNLRITAPGTVGISNDLEITGSLTLGGTEVTSTAAEINLLDASNGSPSAGAWAAVERVGVYTFSGAKAGSAIGGGGTDHVLGTLPAGAYVTEAYLDITSVFAVAGGAVAISLGTATTYPVASRPFLEVCQPSAIPRTGGSVDATAAPGIGVLTLSAGSGFSPALFPGAKLPAQENVVLNVADGAGGTDGVTASGATLILKYIVM